MTRIEYVQREVLNSFCDSGENVDQTILRAVNRDAGKTGVTISRAEVVAALTELVVGGLATAWHLSEWPGQSVQLPDMPRVDEIEERFQTYFFITERGMQVHLSDDIWLPTDDNGNLKLGWHLDG